MREIKASVLVVLMVIVASTLALSMRTSPHKHIEGTWVLSDHKVEKVVHRTRSSARTVNGKTTTIFIPHECARWEFDKNQQLYVTDYQGRRAKANWSLKSRGDLLEIKCMGGKLQDLTIERLDDTEMVLYYHSDLQIRGIIKMTLKKIS